MEGLNWIAIVVAGLVPSVMGFLWYGPIMGKQWLASTGKTEEWYREQGNMPMIMGIAIVLAIVLAWTLKIFIVTTHGDHLMGCTDMAGVAAIGSHHTFGHGALHGAMYSAFWLIPIFVTNGMFERRGPKNYWINIVYWVITCAIMGGILDAWN